MFTKKSKLYLAVITITFSFLLVGCAVVMSPLPVGLYSSAKFPLDYETGNSENLEYKVLGTVYGKAKATSILGLFATGDASISAAFSDAMSQYPEADGLIEICIDYQTESLLGLFASMTTIVKGKAIKHQKSSSQAESQKEDKKVVVSEENKDAIHEESAQQESKVDSEEFLKWKAKVFSTLNKSEYYWNWKSYKERNAIKSTKKEWAESLTKLEYINYLNSGHSVSKWLEKKLSE